MRPHVLRVAATWLGFILACSSGEPTLEPIARLADLVASPAAAPAAAIGDETRTVLQARASAAWPGSPEFIETPAVEISADARLDFGIGVSGRGAGRFSLQLCDGAACEPVFTESLEAGSAADTGWHDRSVSLAAFAGTARSFRFETLREPGEPALPMWSNPVVFAAAGRGADDLGIILLSIDTLRADHLPSYGYPLDTAPFIDEVLAREGTLFEALVAAATTTSPAHATMLTSLPPSVHRSTSNFGTRAPAATLLSEALRSAGFATAAITEDGPMNAALFGRGFDLFAENKSADLRRPSGQVDRTFARARSWLRQQRGKRFFLFLHTFQVHFPYAAPPRYAALFPTLPPGQAPRPGLSPGRDPRFYDREIRYVDDELRVFFEFLEAEKLSNRLLFVLTSDHGDAFLEHGFWGHGADVHGEVTRVPLVFWGRGVAPGQRVGEPVGHVDLLPTILELAGVKIPGSATGRSLASRVRGEGELSVEPVYSEAWYPWGRGPDGARRIDQPTLAVRLGSRKLIRRRTQEGFEYAYYDLASDPDEQRDRSFEAAGEFADLRALIDAYGELEPASAEPEDEPAALDPQRLEKLEALGYVE